MHICEQINCFSDCFYSLHQLGSVLYINKSLCLWWLFNWCKALVLCVHFGKCSVWLTSWLVRGCMSFQICQCCRDHSVTSSPLCESLSTERSISSHSLTCPLWVNRCGCAFIRLKGQKWQPVNMKEACSEKYTPSGWFETWLPCQTLL